MLENYQTLLETLLEKLTDRFDKTKFLTFIRQFLNQNYCLDFLFQLMENSSTLVTENIIKIF